MKLKFVIKRKNLEYSLNLAMSVLFVLYCFYSYGLQPYFTWKTFYGGIFGFAGNVPFKSILALFIVILSIFWFMKKQPCNKIMIFFAVWLFFTCIIGMFRGGASRIFSAGWLIYIVSAMFILSSEDIKSYSYKLLYNIFVITLIIPIIIYIIIHIGITVPFMKIEAFEDLKTNYGTYYKIYPLASQWANDYIGSYYDLRLCGIYNEPGVVGTYTALLLCIEEYKLKGNWKNKILFIGGILSFSLAFYFLTIAFFIGKLIHLKRKNIFIFIIIIISYIVFININISNPDIANIQSRLKITSIGLEGDNRTNVQYNKIINEFLENKNITSLLFGNGDMAMNTIQTEKSIDGSSYKELIYNFGFLGFMSQILWLILFIFIIRNNNKHIDKKFLIILLFVYLLNLYQRPSMFALQYLIIFVGGIYYKIEKNICNDKIYNKKITII